MENRVSNDQLVELLNFLSENPALAKGVGVGYRSKESVDKQWNDLAKRLNSYSSGSSKSGERWKRYWADIKHKSKTRLANRKRDPLGTGGGPSSQEDVSELDKKILSILGNSVSPQAVFDDSEHRVPAFKVEYMIQSDDIHELELEDIQETKPTIATNAMKIGFLGGGRLAYALANGFISAGLATPDEITASCHPSDVASADLFKKLGATAVFENSPVVERSDVVIVSLKPDVVAPVLREIQGLPATKSRLFISVAMGVSIKTIEKALPPDTRVIRVMPNTPALVKQGAAALSRGSKATAEDAELGVKLFKAVGTCDEVPEYQMDAVTALSGSGPAYIYLVIEALAEGGVRCGLPRDLALRLASQTTLGAAAMVREGGHPAILRDNVTSPAGSTAEGTYQLEQQGVRAAIISAVKAASDRCKVVNEQLNK